MYNIFDSKSKKSTRQYLPEGEPPPKKLVTEGDIVVRELAKNQLKTDISLTEQLAKNKEFTAPETFSEVTAHIRGQTDLEEFKSAVVQIDKTNELISKGLTQQDIKLYEEFTTLGSELFWQQDRDISRDVLKERIEEILKIACAPVEKRKCKVQYLISRHQQEYLNALKPQSIENKLLKFATENKSCRVHLPGPMDYLPDLDKKLQEEIQDYSQLDLKKMRKKARSLGKQIQELDNCKPKPDDKQSKASLNRQSLWDVKEVPQEIITVKQEEKVYSCKPQNWYCIKDGEIVKLNKDHTIPKSKLTLEEIKGIPKFANYTTGAPSNKLFLKNLADTVTPELLQTLLKHFEAQNMEIKIMGGRMKGQGFIKFRDEAQATEALGILNGVLVKERPIIAQYGKKP
ncbi:RNA-binding protein 41-like [Anthonomus grandis grandis]|uniref:RNA-binding protein 41-like n=1 Tax=Anthonomus grandis grandis TaxID=2921223 RepID=UPI00216654DD|nr:RNA-binding protein 41-like [Anthonomus grandis grandis]XP_050299295.1 RNA-binding protein 41-like [Anthonomus grandis grandis]XP_050299296.1 RNA-binding protein 41-like [Anthonomus grandis grandis]XP_050299297.1 RNA-binding protein 41-like [Anthonomus grandis grandis]